MPTPISEVRALLDSADAAEATTSVLALLEGQTLDLAYFTVADQTGFTVPDNTYGRKGAVPYFGNNPITEGQSVNVSGGIESTGTAARILLASFAVPAGAMVANQNFRLFADLFFAFSAVNVDAWMIQIDTSSGATMDGGLIVPIADARLQRVTLEGRIRLAASGESNVQLAENGVAGMLVNSAVGSAKTATLTGKILENGSDIITSTPTDEAVNVANSIKIYLVDLSATASQTATVTGRATLSLL